MKKSINYLFVLFSFISNGQTNLGMNDRNLTILFDSIVLKDTLLKVTKKDAFPVSDIKPKIQEKLKYTQKLKMWDDNLRVMLDNPHYTEQEKVQFIKDALADTTRDAFEDINSRSIKFWSASNESEQLIEEYFKRKEFHNSDDPFVKFKHFEFRTKNFLPDAHDLIADYFQHRDSLKDKCYFEADLISILIELKKETEAVKYLEVLLNDYVNDRIQYISFGESVFQYNGNLFDHLCFSEDQNIAQRSTDLLFKFLEVKDFFREDLFRLTAYLNEERHVRLVEKKLERYKTTNFSSLNAPSQNVFDESTAEARSFFPFLLHQSKFLGRTRGRDMWNLFVETMPFWGARSESFDYCQMRILEHSFLDKSLSMEDKRQMLFQMKKTELLLSGGDWSARYLALVFQAYPDKNVPEKDFVKLQLDKFLTYSTPLEINQSSLQFIPTEKKLDKESRTKVVSDFNNFMHSGDLDTFKLSERELFMLSDISTQSCMLNLFEKEENIIRFNLGIFADNYTHLYVDFFDNQLKPVLNRNGLFDFQISQLREVISNDESRYKIYINYKTSTFLFEYSDLDEDRFYPQKFLKALNLCLIESQSQLRFIAIETGDPIYTFILAEPEKVKPLLEKYNIISWAVTYNDVFNTMNR